MVARGADDPGDATDAPSAGTRGCVTARSIRWRGRGRQGSARPRHRCRNAAATSSGPSSGLSDDTSSVSSTGSSSRRSRSISANLAACMIAVAGASPSGEPAAAIAGCSRNGKPAVATISDRTISEVVGVPSVSAASTVDFRADSVRRVTPRGSRARWRWRASAAPGGGPAVRRRPRPSMRDRRPVRRAGRVLRRRADARRR